MAAQTSSRKQWRLFRGPKGDVQSLGWAEFGCPESQVKLAKELLEDNGEECLDKEEKCRLGVYWLLKASEKGHLEGTTMLQECLDNGIGITEHNLSDVQSCLAMPKGEKLSREAAKELFLSLSQGENYITSSQLFRETLRYSEGPIPIESGTRLEWSDYESMESSERLTEEMVVAAGGQHLQGELPSVLGRPLARSPLASGTARIATLPIVLPPAYIVLLMSLLDEISILDAAPVLIYYFSLVSMIISTCRILSKKWEFNQFQRWSYTLVACGCSEEVSAQAQWSHCILNTQPFFIFIASLAINLISSSYVPNIPYSEIATMSTLLSIYMLYNLMWKNKRIDFLVILTFIIHLVARYPYEIDTFVYHYWRYLDVHVPTFTSLAVGTSIQFCLNFRVILYLMLPGFFLKIASRDRWLGIYSTLLPHFVCLAWWQAAVTASNGATYFGLIRSCLGLVLMILFLPLSSISTLLFPILMIAKFFVTEQISSHLALGGACLVSIVYFGRIYKKRWRLFSLIQVVLFILSVFFFLNPGQVETVERVNLNWKDITEVCGKEDIESQERCVSFTGQPVSWEGRVMSARLSSVHNPLQPLINHLPLDIQEMVLCYLGEYYEDCKSKEYCINSYRKCTISNWNRYEYEIDTELPVDGWTESSTVVRLKGGHNFRNFSVSLAVGDRIWFSGTLHGQISGTLLVSLVGAKCLSCPLTAQETAEVHPLPMSRLFIEKLVLFIFHPFVTLRVP